jgi:hypothetical protein
MKTVNAATSVQIIQEATQSIRRDLAGVATLRKFRTSLQELYCRFTQSKLKSLMVQVEWQLGELKRIIDAAMEDPSVLPHPSPCNLDFEATIRARFGLRAAADYCSHLVLEELRPLRDDTEALLHPTRQVQDSHRDVADVLLKCHEGVNGTFDAYHGLEQCLEKMCSGGPSWEIARLRGSLDLDVFETCMSKLAALLPTLASLEAATKQRVHLIREFVKRVPDTVEAAFRLPFPINIAQGVLMGESPPVKASLLAKAQAISALQLECALDEFQRVQNGLAALQMTSAREIFTIASVKADRHLTTLAHDLSQLEHSNVQTPEDVPSRRTIDDIDMPSFRNHNPGGAAVSGADCVSEDKAQRPEDRQNLHSLGDGEAEISESVPLLEAQPAIPPALKDVELMQPNTSSPHNVTLCKAGNGVEAGEQAEVTGSTADPPEEQYFELKSPNEGATSDRQVADTTRRLLLSSSNEETHDASFGVEQDLQRLCPEAGTGIGDGL